MDEGDKNKGSRSRPANAPIRGAMVQIAVRLPEDLLADLQEQADKTGLATTSYIRMVLTQHIRDAKGGS